MKHVTFTRDMRPYRVGDLRLVPDDVATQLEANGDIAPNPPSWPAPAAADEKPVPAPSRGRLRLPRGRDLLGQTYLTK